MSRTGLKKIILGLLALTSTVTATAQRVLPLDEALAWALTEHPMATMAEAVEQRGPAALLEAKGAFDPKIAGAYDRKQFLGDRYWDILDASLEWQSPYAVKVSAGYDYAVGEYINDDLNLPSGGQPYLAVKLPLLQGLMTDAARTDRRRGEVAVGRQRAIADIIRNELRYDLSVRYAEWFYAERALQININTENLLARYLADTRELFRLGDKAAVDTLEASVYLNTQRLATRQARVDAQVAALAFSELYWPLEPGDSPTALDPAFLVLPDVDWAVGQPELRELQLAITDFELEQRFKREKLKPKLDLAYYLLGSGTDLPAGSSEFGNPLSRAYKVEARASYPLFNRQARGAVEAGRLKIVETEAKLSDKRQALNAKAAAYRAALAAYTDQLRQASDLVRQSEQLLAAERELFDLGESTQFLLNVRQQNLQKAQLVRQKLIFSRDKAVIGWRGGVGVW